MKTNSWMILLLISMGLLAGCQSGQNAIVDDDVYRFRVPEVAPIEAIPIQNEANVRLPEMIKAYAVNRYKDPNDPRIMHERHVMYRKEQDPDWRLASNAERQILVGPVMTDASLENTPALLERELALELEKQRAMYDIQRASMEKMHEERVIMSQLLIDLYNKVEKLEIKERSPDEANF